MASDLPINETITKLKKLVTLHLVLFIWGCDTTRELLHLDNIFCYNVMSFGLKNMRAMYQCIVTKIFQPLLKKTMVVYVDDMLVKSRA